MGTLRSWFIGLGAPASVALPLAAYMAPPMEDVRPDTILHQTGYAQITKDVIPNAVAQGLTKIHAQFLGKDDRQVIPNSERVQDYSEMGHFLSKKGGYCTVTLVDIPGYRPVSGRVGITADHCGDGQGFITAFPQGENTGFLMAPIADSYETPEADMKLVHIDDDLPEIPYSRMIDFNVQAADEAISSFGFAFDKEGLKMGDKVYPALTVHEQCSISSNTYTNHPTVTLTDCDLYSGASGGAITNSEGSVIGVNTFITSQWENGFTSVQELEPYLPDVPFLEATFE